MYFKKASGAQNEWWRYVITAVITFMSLSFIGHLPMIAVQYYKISTNPDIGPSQVNEFRETMKFELMDISPNFGFFLMLLIFIISMVLFMLCIRYLHRLPFQRLITPLEKINWNKVLFGFGLWFLFALAGEVVSYFLSPETYVLNFKGGSFFILLLMCLVLLPIQTSFEELFFRGYLMTRMGRFFKSKIIPLIIVCILFGLIHGGNPEVEKFGFWTMQLYYVLAGLFLGLITILDDSLELALGVHAATNIFGASILSFDGSVLQTDTLFKTSHINPNLMTLWFVLFGALFIFICAKKYKWSFSKITEPVPPIEENNMLSL